MRRGSTGEEESPRERRVGWSNVPRFCGTRAADHAPERLQRVDGIEVWECARCYTRWQTRQDRHD